MVDLGNEVILLLLRLLLSKIEADHHYLQFVGGDFLGAPAA